MDKGMNLRKEMATGHKKAAKEASSGPPHHKEAVSKPNMNKGGVCPPVAAKKNMKSGGKPR